MTKKHRKEINQKLIYAANILCGFLIFWVSVQSASFAIIFYSLLLASQIIFWGIRKLRDDKKWLGYYSKIGIVFISLSIIPLYIALFTVINYTSIDAYLGIVGWKGIPDILKIAFFLKH